MSHFLVAFKTVLPLFLVIITGLLFSRTKAASESWITVLNKFALWIGFPALVIASLMHLELGERSYVSLIVYNSVYIVVCMLLVFPLSRIFGLSVKMKQTLILIFPFGNIAYLGIPILQNAFGDDILPTAAIISAVFIFWLLTLGLVCIEILGDEKISMKKQLLNLISNPLLLAVFIGLLIVLFRIKLPDFVEKTITLFGDSVTAVVLFSLGIFLGMQKVGNIKEWYRVLGFVVLTMIVLPFAFYQILLFTKFDTTFLKASVIDATMPLGLTPYALSVQYKLETTLSARIVVLGTLLSILIVPLWMVVLT